MATVQARFTVYAENVLSASVDFRGLGVETCDMLLVHEATWGPSGSALQNPTGWHGFLAYSLIATPPGLIGSIKEHYVTAGDALLYTFNHVSGGSVGTHLLDCYVLRDIARGGPAPYLALESGGQTATQTVAAAPVSVTHGAAAGHVCSDDLMMGFAAAGLSGGGLGAWSVNSPWAERLDTAQGPLSIVGCTYVPESVGTGVNPTFTAAQAVNTIYKGAFVIGVMDGSCGNACSPLPVEGGADDPNNQWQLYYF